MTKSWKKILKPVLLIRIHLIWIRIRIPSSISSESGSEPDPAFQANPDPSRIRIPKKYPSRNIAPLKICRNSHALYHLSHKSPYYELVRTGTSSLIQKICFIWNRIDRQSCIRQISWRALIGIFWEGEDFHDFFIEISLEMPIVRTSPPPHTKKN